MASLTQAFDSSPGKAPTSLGSGASGLSPGFETIPAGAPGSADQEISPWYQRFMQGVIDPVNRGVQLLTNAIAPVGAKIAEAVGGADSELGRALASAPDSINAEMWRNEQAYKAQNTGLQGPDWWRMAGWTVSPVNLMLGPQAEGALGARLAINAATSAAISPLYMPAPDPSQGYWGQLAKQGLMGALTGAVATGAGSALAGAIKPTINEDAGLLLQNGVKPTVGQLLGPTATKLEDAVSNLPLVGGVVKGGQRSALEQFNQGAYERVLAPVRAIDPSIPNVPSGMIGHDAIDFIAKTLGDNFDAVTPRLTFQPTPNFMAGMQQLAQKVQQLPEGEQKQFYNLFSSQLGKADPQTGIMDGETVKTVMSELNRWGRNYAKDPSADKRELGSLLTEAEGHFMDALKASNPSDAERLDALRTGWANFSRVRAAAANPNAQNGVFTGAQLNSAVRSADNSVAHGNFAKGKALMQDYANAGKNVLSQQLPDSGTAYRAAITDLALGGGALAYDPLTTAASAAALAGAYSNPGRAAIASLLTNRPAVATPIANMVRFKTPLLAPAAAYPLQGSGDSKGER